MAQGTFQARYAGLALSGVFGVSLTLGLDAGPRIPETMVWMGARVAGVVARRLAPVPKTALWNGVVYLKSPNLAALEAAARAVSNPASRQYHHFWTRAEIMQKFAPSMQALAAARDSLRQEGFVVGSATGLGLGLHVSGSVGLVDRVWAARLKRTASGQSIATRPVVLKGPLAQSVAYISNLSARGERRAPVVRAFTPSVTTLTVQSPDHNISLTPEGPISVAAGQNILLALHAVDATTHQPLKGWNIAANPSFNANLSSYQVGDLNGSLALNQSGKDVVVLSSSSPYQGKWQISLSHGSSTYSATVTGLAWTGPTVVSSNLSPQQVNTAYHANALVSAARKAGGMRIGIFADSRPTLSDMTLFEKRFHLPPSAVHIIPVDGGETKAVPGWHGELMLDMERAVSSAPGATLDLYTVPPKGSITDTVAAAVNQNVDQVYSISAVEPEGSMASARVKVWDALLAEGTLQGMTFVAGSGDSGPFADPHSNRPIVNWPAASAWVTAVGGTQLGLNPHTSAIQSQWAWGPDGLWENQIDGSGGGYSQIQPVPSWQKGIVPASAPGRGVPDIAFLGAAPYYATVDDGIWEGMAGTSASAPTWAGWVADLAVLDGRQGWMNPTLYAIYRSDSAAFDPVTHGQNSVYQAGPGWNPLTGLGSVVLDRFWEDDRVASVKVTAVRPTKNAKTIAVQVSLFNRRGRPATLAGLEVQLTVPGGRLVSVNGGPSGIGGTATSNAHGQAVFHLVSRQPGRFTVRVRVVANGRTLAVGKPLPLNWTRSEASAPPIMVRLSGSTPELAANSARMLYPTGVVSHTALILAPGLTPKLALAAVTLAKAESAPVLFTNRSGALPTVSIETMRALQITHVIALGQMTAKGLGLPAGISLSEQVWSPLAANTFVQVAEQTLVREKSRRLIVVSGQAPAFTRLAAVNLAVSRRAGLLMLPAGPVVGSASHLLSSVRSVVLVGRLPSASKVRRRPTATVMGSTDVKTLLAADVARGSANNLVIFNGDAVNETALSVIAAEIAANIPSALIPVGRSGIAPPVSAYLGRIASRQLNNLVVVGESSQVGGQVERKLRS